MRKGIWSGAALVLVVATGVLARSGGAGAAPNTVNMVDGSGDPTTTWKFDPPSFTVAAGMTVTWHNSGQQPHTVTADDGSFKSTSPEYIGPGGDFQHAFATAGDFAYHCEPHPWMKGVIHVTGTATTAPGATTTSPAATATTATTAAGGATTTTTAKAGASSTTTTTAAAGATTTTTAAPATGATTTTTAAPAAAGGESTTTTSAAGAGSGESAAGGHRKTDSGETDKPMVAVAGVLTLALLGLSGKLLLSKSRPH